MIACHKYSSSSPPSHGNAFQILPSRVYTAWDTYYYQTDDARGQGTHSAAAPDVNSDSTSPALRTASERNRLHGKILQHPGAGTA